MAGNRGGRKRHIEILSMYRNILMSVFAKKNIFLYFSKIKVLSSQHSRTRPFIYIFTLLVCLSLCQYPINTITTKLFARGQGLRLKHTWKVTAWENVPNIAQTTKINPVKKLFNLWSGFGSTQKLFLKFRYIVMFSRKIEPGSRFVSVQNGGGNSFNEEVFYRFKMNGK